MPFPVDVNALGSVSGSQTLAAAGHATRHNEVKTALEGIRDALGGTAVPSGTVQPILAAGSASAPSLSFTGDSNTGLWSPAADTVAASTGGTERMRIDNAGLITGTGTSLGAWTAYTPTLSGTGWAIGNGTANGFYCQIGKMVFFRVGITFGSTSTFGASASPLVSLPITEDSASPRSFTMWAQGADTSAGQLYLFNAFRGGTAANVEVQTIGTNGLGAAVTATVPFTWASTDLLRLSGTYQAA